MHTSTDGNVCHKNDTSVLQFLLTYWVQAKCTEIC